MSEHKEFEEFEEFEYIWNNIVTPISNLVMAESDREFAKTFHLSYRGNAKWKKRVEDEYHRQRHYLKRLCYAGKMQQSTSPLLDSRKVAAILCKTFLVQKAFSFDVETVKNWCVSKKKSLGDIEYTKWAIDNVLINYKFAYLVSIQLVYTTLLSNLLDSDITVPMGKKLNEIGHLLQYPSDPNCDTFDMNVVIGLARGDVFQQQLNMLLYAMVLYQVEMYTRERLTSMLEGTHSI